MKLLDIGQIGFEVSQLQINKLPPKCLTIHPLDLSTQRKLYFEQQKFCSSLTKPSSGYRHQTCIVQKFQQPPKIIVKRSSIHGYGLFANRILQKGTPICEYQGIMYNSLALADLAEKKLMEYGFDSTYMFRIGQKTSVIDATFTGNSARFANHSCSPNALSKQQNGHVYLLAVRDILIGEEITYNYNMRYVSGMKRAICYCGCDNCNGYMDQK
ncbi:Histone-lysine N-methyltransferase SETD1 [Spironucleus salmonicida]|uniref:Histone-lysine N-methyltransferase SETD1 n=1 Tax=Spironucleus salmonicida TaxID=348837 RepID=V6M5I9_9EUKA|nr:Histone-lysine N-methyltransferase SETD1 [Spironucleus salmonicida]|eukprot:EST48629.1 SET domain-containing protein [Spironucleus salmonicida]